MAVSRATRRFSRFSDAFRWIGRVADIEEPHVGFAGVDRTRRGVDSTAACSDQEREDDGDATHAHIVPLAEHRRTSPAASNPPELAAPCCRFASEPAPGTKRPPCASSVTSGRQAGVYACDDERAIFCFLDHWQAGLCGNVTVYPTDEALVFAADLHRHQSRKGRASRTRPLHFVGNGGRRFSGRADD